MSLDTDDTLKLDTLAALSGHVRTDTVRTALDNLATWVRGRGHTARATMLLAFVAPLFLKKPAHSGHPPEGWSVVMLVNHLLPECNGTWWAPDEVVTELGRSWKYVRNATIETNGDEIARDVSAVPPGWMLCHADGSPA